MTAPAGAPPRLASTNSRHSNRHRYQQYDTVALTKISCHKGILLPTCSELSQSDTKSTMLYRIPTESSTMSMSMGSFVISSRKMCALQLQFCVRSEPDEPSPDSTCRRGNLLVTRYPAVLIAKAFLSFSWSQNHRGDEKSDKHNY